MPFVPQGERQRAVNKKGHGQLERQTRELRSTAHSLEHFACRSALLCRKHTSSRSKYRVSNSHWESDADEKNYPLAARDPNCGNRVRYHAASRTTELFGFRRGRACDKRN